jgi:hypothetical protein
MPSFRDNAAYWTCLQHVYEDGTKTYTGLVLMTPKISIETTKI